LSGVLFSNQIVDFRRGQGGSIHDVIDKPCVALPLLNVPISKALKFVGNLAVFTPSWNSSPSMWVCIGSSLLEDEEVPVGQEGGRIAKPAETRTGSC
jgi:hypothetical protein